MSAAKLPPAKIGTWEDYPTIPIVFGVLLMLTGRGVPGLLLLVFGIVWLMIRRGLFIPRGRS